MKNLNKKNNGFTLIEFFVLSAFIGATVLISFGLKDPRSKVATEAVYNIDSKLDDGNGITGNIRAAVNPDKCTNEDGTYRLDSTEPLNCSFAVKLGD
jgi:hypothetical protein